MGIVNNLRRNQEQMGKSSPCGNSLDILKQYFVRVRDVFLAMPCSEVTQSDSKSCAVSVLRYK